MSKLTQHVRVCVVTCALLVWMLRPATALDIIPIFNAGASGALSDDPASAGLISLFNYAETYYEGVIQDAHTLTINFWYEDLDSRGSHSWVANDGQRITKSNIRIDTLVGGEERNWWIDPTPHDDSEYDMHDVLWEDLSTDDKLSYYNYSFDSIPDTFEVGYVGSAKMGSSAAGRLDMLSVVLHEVGHALGLSGGAPLAVTETMDFDYDIDPDFVFNRVLGANVNAPDNVFHLANDFANMDTNSLVWPTSVNEGSRKRPGHTDLFAIASASDYETLHVPRRTFYGGTNWETSGNWSGNRVPGVFDDAVVQHGGSLTLSSDKLVRSLSVRRDTLFQTASNQLTISEDLSVNSQAVVTIDLGGKIATDNVYVDAVSRINVNGSLEAQDVNNFGTIEGTGFLDITNPVGTFVNDGTLRGDSGGKLTVVTPSLLDLDGINEQGVLLAVEGDLEFSGALTDAFNGFAQVAAGRAITFNNSLTIGSGGLLRLDGTQNSAATVDGGVILSVGAGGSIGGTGLADVDNVVSLDSGGTVEAISSSSELRLRSTTLLDGGTITGDGTVMQIGNAVVRQDTTVNAATYDMDGNGGSTIDIDPSAILTINSPSIESSGGGDGYDGTLNVNRGALIVNTDWLVEGTINMNDNGAGQPTLGGTGVLSLQGGTINFNGGEADVDAQVVSTGGNLFVAADATMRDAVLGNGTSVQVNNATDSLTLNGTTLLTNPSITGSGVVRFNGVVNVGFFDTAIGVASVDLDGSSGMTEINIGSGLTFSIASTVIETTANDGFDGTINNQGTFSVLAGWQLDGELNMTPLGANVARLAGAGPFVLSDGAVMNTTGNAAVDMPMEALDGTININSGLTEINGSLAFSSTDVNIEAGAELRLNSSTEFGAGTYLGDGLLTLNGPTNVTSNTLIRVSTVDLDGTLGDTELTLDGFGIDSSGLTLFVDTIDVGFLPYRYDGTLNTSGRGLSIFLNDPQQSWQMNGTTNVSGGTGISAATVFDGSDVVVTGTINADGDVQSQATLDFRGVLNTNDSTTNFIFTQPNNRIRNTATFNGNGGLTVSTLGELQVEDGSDVELDLLNRGRFEPGLSTTGSVVLASYEQTSSGVLGIEVAASPGGSQDLVTVNGITNLAGEIEVSFLDGFIPDEGDTYLVIDGNDLQTFGTFDVLTILAPPGPLTINGAMIYAGWNVFFNVQDITLDGDFNDDFDYDCADVDALVAEIAGGGSDLAFDLNDDLSVDTADLDEWLQLAGTWNVGGAYLPGDANLDGVVDGLDFIEWNTHKFSSIAAWCSGDFTADGVVDGLDFIRWNSFKFMSSDVATGFAVPEPVSLCWGIVCALAAASLRRKR